MRKLLIVVVSVALFLAGCKSKQGARPLYIDPALMTLVPTDTIMLAGVRMDELQKTALYQKHFASRELPAVDDLVKKTGIDPRKDLWQVLVASTGKHTVIMARGKFSEMGMEPRIHIEGAERIPYKGTQLIGRTEGAIAFLNPTTAIAGKVDALMYIIDHRDETTVSPELKESLAMIPNGVQLWMVALGGQKASALGIPLEGNLANLGRIYSSLQRMMLSADLSRELHIQGRGIAATDQDANQLATALKGIIGLGRLNTPTDRNDLLRVYDAIKVEQKQRDVTLDAEIPEELIDKLLALFPK
jgi:hypothetical protein